MGSSWIRCTLLMLGAAQALGHSLDAHAEETLYRMNLVAVQQTSVQAGILRTEPPMQLVDMLLAPVKGDRKARHEHHFPSREGPPPSLPLVVREIADLDQIQFERTHPFEHTFKRILVYWGCGEQVGRGQPRVIDVHPADYQRLRRLLTVSPEDSPGTNWIRHVDSSNRMIAMRDVRLPEDARVHGTHELRIGTASVKFDVDSIAEPLPPVTITHVSALPDGPIRVRWQNLPRANAYFANVFIQRKLSREVVIWTSSRKAEGGWLFYKSHPGAAIEALRANGVLLPAGTDECVVPTAVRRHTPDPMVFQLHAYAPELAVPAQSFGASLPNTLRIASRSTASVLLEALNLQRSAALAP